MLSNEADYIVGIDTHKETNTASVLEPATAAFTDPVTVITDQSGHKALLRYAGEHAPGPRVWAIESTGHYGAGLTAYLQERGERVYELDRPKRLARRDGAKSDELDAARAARELLERRHLTQPKLRGDREALRVLARTRAMAIGHRADSIKSLKSSLVICPEVLRDRLRSLGTAELIQRCSRLRITGGSSEELAMTKLSMRSTAGRIQDLTEEIAILDREIERLVLKICPALIELPGIRATTAAELICAFSHPGRFRSESAFASLAGVSPIPASSGKLVRHRLNRSGDRRLNKALTTIAQSRMRYDRKTQDYVERRTAEGKSKKEIKRCLKRYIARSVFRVMEAEMA